MSREPERRHICTIEVEDYFQAGTFGKLIPFEHWQRFETRVRRNTDAALELLDRHGATATFFSSGWVADQHPRILRGIVDAGHEVACHGYYAQSARELPPPAFRDDLRRSRTAIEQATGRRVQGFRIGRGWVAPDDFWLLDVLAEEGFDYDASLCPRGRQFAERPECFVVHEQRRAAGGLWEIPVSAHQLGGFSIPFAGGNWTRQLPIAPMRRVARQWAARGGAPVVSYFHIWELDIEQPSIRGVSWLQRIRHYRNLASMPERIAWFLATFPSGSIAEYLELEPEMLAHGPAADAPAEPAVATADAAMAVPLSIVVPCFNEVDSLSYLDNTLADFVERSRGRLAPDFVLVDDGSSDDTWAEMQTRFGGREGFRLVRHERNEGITAAILTGVAAATAERVAVLDADCTFDPNQLVHMVPLLTEDVAAVCGSPYFGSATRVPAWRRVLSLGAAALYRLVLRHKFANYTSCFRVYRRSALDGMQVANRRYCGVTEILVRLDLAGQRLVESRAALDTRVLGASKINTLRTTFDHLRLIARTAAARWFGLPLPPGRTATAP